jgi:hypothetical protein
VTLRTGAILLLVLPLLATAGCASQQPGQHPVHDELRLLPGRFADEPVTKPLAAVEAYIGRDEFFVAYEGEDGLVYAGGNWSNRVDLTALRQGPDGDYAGPFILPLEYHRATRWEALPDDPIVPRLLSSKYWNRFIDEVFETVLPKADMTGIVMHFGEEDYFLYYNDINNFEARLIIDKPDNYVVDETMDFMEFIERAQPVLERFLEEEGIEERRIVFSTGDTGTYSLPFIFIDRDIPIGIFVRYAPAPPDGRAASKAAQIAQSTGHVAQSHLGGLLSRPVSSVYRLLFVAKDVAVETVTPSWLVTLESESIPGLSDGPGMDLQAWEDELTRVTGHEATQGTIDYLIDGNEFFVRYIDAISTATDSVDIRTYIFDNDDFAARIRDLLRRRSEEGVAIRILLDGLGTIVATGADDASMPTDYAAPQSVRESLESGSEISVRQWNCAARSCTYSAKSSSVPGRTQGRWAMPVTYCRRCVCVTAAAKTSVIHCVSCTRAPATPRSSGRSAPLFEMLASTSSSRTPISPTMRCCTSSRRQDEEASTSGSYCRWSATTAP